MSSNVVQCDCGASVRVPENRANKSFRCPKCKKSLALTIDAKVLSVTTLSAGQDAVCPICQTGIGADEGCVTCPDCDQIHHQECWGEMNGCGTYGCSQAPEIDKSEQSTQAPLTAWGDTKECPACGETIKSIALRCRYCDTDFHTVDPLTRADLRRQERKEEELDTFRRNVIALFAASIIGCLAPITLIAGLVYVLPKRKQLARCGPLYVTMGWILTILSGFYSVLLVLFVIGEMTF